MVDGEGCHVVHCSGGPYCTLEGVFWFGRIDVLLLREGMEVDVCSIVFGKMTHGHK